jgi:F0F1-type ATP synthase membrane subunit b/b'
MEAVTEEAKVEARKTISENIELSEEDIQQAKQQAIAKASG